MSFHNVSLPDSFQYGSVFGNSFTTVVQTTATGHEYRLARQQQSRHRYALLKQLQSATEAAVIKTFAMSRRDALHGFRLKDWFDYTSNDNGQTAPTHLDQVIGIGDGATTQFQLIKTYDESGLDPYVRTIELPVAATVLVGVNGSDVSGSSSFTNPGGVVTVASPPAIGHVVTAGFQFDVPVRFEGTADQWMRMRADAFETWSLDSLACIEVLNEVEWPELWYPGGATNHGAVSQSLTISYGEGLLHLLQPSGAISVFLPAPDRMTGGPHHFVIAVNGGAGSVQIRDDAGNAVGSTISSGTTKRVGCSVASGAATWVVY